MFGQSNNTPFGGGFGQQTNTTPAFGSPNPGQPQPGGLFSSPQPVFGQQQQQQPSSNVFGAPSTAFGGGGGGFGQAATPQPGMFGAPAPAPTGFGGGGGAFGAPPAPSNTFGSTGGGLFGSSSVGGFGQPAPSGGGLFGQAPAPTFGAAPTSTFGAAPTSTFGAPSTGLFGAAPAPTNAFGAPSPTAFGAPQGFGAPAPSAFGGPSAPPSTGFFGSTPSQAPFGAPAPVGGLFGSTPAPAATGFGATTSLFGGTPSPATAFRSPPAQSTGFGAPGGLFGANTSVMSSGAGAGGTRIAPYQVTSRQDGTATINLQSISAMEQYKDQSHEELRFADYSQGNRGTASPAPAAFGGFGVQAPAPMGGGLFGATPAPTNTFGAPGGGLFGSTPAPAFGAAPAPLGGFGQTTGGSLFGQAPAPSTAFGAPAPAFGSPAPATGGLFGAPAPTGLFGSNPAPAPFGAPAPSGLFGATPAPSTGFGGLLGSNPAPSAFGAPASGGIFGAPAPTTGGLFGSPTPAPFGQAFGAPAPSLFGAAPASFGAPVQSGYFGQQPAPLQQQQFHQQVQPLQIQTMFNAPIIAPGVSEVLEQQIRALTNQLDENKKLEVWRGPKTPSSPSTTPTSNHNTSTFFSRNVGNDVSMYKTPSSASQIRPRGFAQSEPSKSAVLEISSGRDNSGLMSPEAFARSSQLSLVVRPDSLRRLNKLNLHRFNHETSAMPNIAEPSIEPVPTEHVTDPLHLTTEENYQSFQNHGAKESGKPKGLQIIEAPTKSPGYEYYQQVIGTSHQGKKQPSTPVANGTSNGSKGKHWYIPQLTKAEYEVSPTIEEMSCMSEADLASVHSFAVSRPGYGKVEWEGSVDVRGANLDEIVVIEAKDVSVYNLDEENGTKPDEGTKLNRPALITFEDVFPKTGVFASDEEKNKFIHKLKKSVVNMNAEFVSYESVDGIWKIRVRHFSRYALVDDDDSDNEVIHNVLAEEIVATPLPKRVMQEKRKATPYHASRVTFVDVTENEEDYSSEEVMAIDPEPLELDIRHRAENAVRAIQASLKDNHSSLVAASEMEVEDDDVYEEEDDDDETLASQFEQFDADELLLARNMSSGTFDDICSRHTKRSFRVGWLPNGSFINLENSSDSFTPILVISHPILAESKSNDASIALLEAQQEIALPLSTGKDECPLFTLCRDFRNVATSLAYSDEAKHAFLFLLRLFPVDQVESVTFSCDETVPSEAQIMAAVNKLLLDLCTLDENKTSNLISVDVIAQISDAISIGNTELACELSASAGFSALAAMLACGSSCQSDVSRLVSEVAFTKELKSTTDPIVSRILQYSSGSFESDNDAFYNGDDNRDWRRRLSMRIRQRPDDTLLQILNGYETSLVAKEVPYPLPSYLSSLSSTSINVESMFYRLLKICSDPKSMSVCEAIDPSGYTLNSHDFYLPFHLAAAMTSISDHLFPLSSYDTEYIKDGYMAQLILQGHWERAVFVLLCCIGDDDYFGKNISTTTSTSVVQKKKQTLWFNNTQKAKSLILRYYDKHDISAQERRRYLEINIGVPSFWFEEASCYRSAVIDGDVLACISYMRSFDLDMWRDAYAAYIFPEHILYKSNTASEEILASLNDTVFGASSDSLSMALFRYMELEKEMISYRKQDENSDRCDNNEQLQTLDDNVNYLYNYFDKLNGMMGKHATTLLSTFLLPSLDFIPESSTSTGKKRMPYPSMVSEVLWNVTKWKKELMYQ